MSLEQITETGISGSFGPVDMGGGMNMGDIIGSAGMLLFFYGVGLAVMLPVLTHLYNRRIERANRERSLRFGPYEGDYNAGEISPKLQDSSYLKF